MTTYYIDQLSKLINSDNLKIKVTGDDTETNWLNLNLDSIDALEQFLASIKAQKIDNLSGDYTHPVNG